MGAQLHFFPACLSLAHLLLETAGKKCRRVCGWGVRLPTVFSPAQAARRKSVFGGKIAGEWENSGRNIWADTHTARLPLSADASRQLSPTEVCPGTNNVQPMVTVVKSSGNM